MVGLGILLAAPLASLSALAAPGGTLGGADAASGESAPLIGALVGDDALGRVVDGGALHAVLAQASADMSLTKTAPATISIGSHLVYTLTVTDLGPSPATNVTVTDLLLNGLTFVSAIPTQGTCAANVQLVTCSIGVMNPGASVSIQISVTPQANLANATVTNNATVQAAQPDPNPNNNTGSAATTINGTGTAVSTGASTNAADMAVTKVGSPNPVNVGNNLTYSYTIVNNGPGVATGAAMSDFIQTDLTFVSATATQGSCTLTNNVLNCTIGTMNPGSVVTITSVVQPQAALANSTITNTASVAAQQPDPNPTNSSATASMQIAPAGAVVVATQTVIAATQTAIAATQTAAGTGPVVPPGVNPPASTGQAGVACTIRVGVCTVTGAATDSFTKLAVGMTFNVTATGPTNTAPRGVPGIFIPTTVGVESFGCTPVGTVVPFSTVCTGTTRGDLVLNATVTVRFPLVGGGTQDVPGTVTGQGGQPQNVQQAIASVAPSGLPGVPCGDVVGQTCQAVGPVQGLGAITGSVTWNLTATVPAGVAAGTVPVAVFSTTVGLEGFPCAAVAAGATTVACAVTTVGNVLLGSNVTVVFAPGTTSVGTVQGPGAIALQALASAPPPLPPPPPFIGPPLPPPPPAPVGLGVQTPSSLLMQPAYPGVPVVPEADSVLLLGGDS